MKIFHLSDTHFGNDGATHSLPQLVGALNQFKDDFVRPDTYLVISGDVTYRGRPDGYSQAVSFVTQTWLAHGGRRENFITCPGNHDLCAGSFDAFDSFVYAIRKNNSLSFKKNAAVLLSNDGTVFLSINSAHHLETGFGFVDIDQLSLLLQSNFQEIAAATRRVAIIHHHLIGVFKEDASTVRNAAALIWLLNKYEFEVVLHGHQHQKSELKVGAVGVEIFSARSFSFPTVGGLNGMFVIDCVDGKWSRTGWVQSLDHSELGKAEFREVR
jgi:3',5'-cyclic AMP phosphodiesterase CpdA